VNDSSGTFIKVSLAAIQLDRLRNVFTQRAERTGAYPDGDGTCKVSMTVSFFSFRHYCPP
jgi:hypothetical protein